VLNTESEKSIWHRIHVSLGHEPWWAEVYSGIATNLWGISVASNRIDLTQIDAWQPLISIAGDSVWGAVAIFCGTVQLLAALLNYRLMRWIACLLCVGFWTLLTNAVWSSGYRGPGLAVYAAWILPSAGSILRLLRRP
jgi:hypothetical protein